MVASGTDREQVRELVAQCLERFEHEGLAAVDSICALHPLHASAIRQRIGKLERAGLLEAPAVKGCAIPAQLGDFKLKRRLGGGGMGVVYVAEQLSLRREVALKLVRPELLYFPGARERFRREVEAVARLNHASIVPIYTFGEEGDVPFYAMEKIDGASLDDVLEILRGRKPAELRGADLLAALERCRAALADPAAPGGGDRAGEPLPSDCVFFASSWVETCLRLVEPVALALEHAHQRGVLHRDLKPSNLMLTRDGRVLLLDFGLASTQGTTRITKSGSQLGSMPYAAPEQIRLGSDTADAKSDVYALGVIFYELLTLEHPYWDKDAEATRRRILAGRPAPPRLRNPALPWDAETVCLVAMDPDPARRYASAAAFAQDLANVVHLRPIAARRPGPWLRLRRGVRRRPTASVAALLGALLLVVGPATWAWQEHRRAREAADFSAHLSKSSKRARQAIGEFLVAVGDQYLANVPGAEPLKKDLLQRATALYDELLADQDDPEVRLEGVEVLRTLARRQAELGLVDSARRSYERALTLIAGVAPDYGATRRAAEIATLGELGTLELAAGALEQGRAVLRRVIPLAAALAREDPSELNRESLAHALVDLALRADAPRAEAEPLVARALELYAQLAREHPESDTYQRQRVTFRLHFALRQDAWGDIEGAEATWRAAIDELDQMLRVRPGILDVERLAVEARLNFGSMLLDHGFAAEVAEAETVLRAALTSYDRLAAASPQRPDLVVGAAHAGIALAEALARQEAMDEARAVHVDVRNRLETLLARFPDEHNARSMLGANERVLGELLIGIAEDAAAAQVLHRAVKILEETVAAQPEQPWNKFELSHALLRLAQQPALLAADESALDFAEQALAQACAATDAVPDQKGFSAQAREAGARAIELALADATGGDAMLARARDALDQLVACGALQIEQLADHHDFVRLVKDPRFLALLPEPDR